MLITYNFLNMGSNCVTSIQNPKAMKSMLARGKGDLETSGFNRA